MTETPRLRRWWKCLLGFFLFSAAGFGLLAWYVSTNSFHELVRKRVVDALETATGGKADIGEFHVVPLHLRVDLRNLTIRGRESAQDVPYFHADRVLAEAKIISLFEREVGLHSLLIEHPVVHLIVYPDGSTNQPRPKVARSPGKSPVEQLFSISASELEVRGGEVIWNLQRMPLDLQAKNVSAKLDYSFLHQRYEANVAVGDVTTRYQQYPPLQWKADSTFTFYRDRAEISSLNILSNNSELHFKGDLKDFATPRLSGDYHAKLDLAELALLSPRKEIRKGWAKLQGKGFWSDSDFSSDGSINVENFDWIDQSLSLRGARLSSNYSITPQRLRFTSLKVNGVGGEMNGEVDVTNWQTPLEPAQARKTRIAHVPPGSLQHGSIRLKLSGFSLTPLLQTISSRKLPLNNLRIAGTASGAIDTLWVGAIRDAETKVDLNIAPPAHPANADLSVHGVITGTYRGSRDELQVDQFRLSTPASEITAKGNLASTSALRFTATSHNVGEWNPLLVAAAGPDPPFGVHGWMTFTGDLTGTLSNFLLTGSLEVYDFETRFRTKSHPDTWVHWDSLTSGIQYSNRNLTLHNGVLIHERTIARFDGNAALSNGALTDRSVLNARIDLHNLDLAEAQQAAGFHYPVTGTADLVGRLAGTPSSPQGEARLEVREASAFGTPIPSLRGRVRIVGDEVQLNDIETAIHNAPIRGNAAVSTSGDSYRFNLTGHDLNLASIPKLQTSKIVVDGVLDFDVSGTGSLQQPSLQGKIHVKDLMLDKERAGDFYVDATTQGNRLIVQAHSDFEKANLRIAGSVGLQHELPADLDLTFQQLDIDSLLKIYLGDRITSHSVTAGVVKIRGPLRNPSDLILSAALESVDLEIEHVRVQNVDPIRVEMADHSLRLEQFHLAGSGTDFTAHGQASLLPPRAIDFRVDGTVNMALLQTLNPRLFSRGTVELNLSANGTVTDPQLQGKVQVRDASLSHNDFPSGLSGLNGTLLFEQNRIRIEQLTGTTGGGTVTLTGSATLQGGTVNLDVAGTAHDVRLRYPAGVSSTANADIRLSGNSHSALLSGDVVVTKLAVTPGFDFGSYLESKKLSVTTATGDSLESRLKLDVHVVTTPELQMQSAIARLSGTADLHVRGTAERPVVVGRAEVLEGEIFFNGTKYRLERGEVTFPNPARTEAHIDLQAATRVRDYDITVRISGDATTPNSLTAKWQSEPPLPEADVIALLALGRTTEESAALQSSSNLGLTGQASNLIISQALNSAVGSRVQRLFGVSRIKIDPQGLATATNVVRGPQVTIEHQVANNMTVTYSTNVSVASQQIIQFEYNVSRNVSVVALRDQNGVLSFDIKIRQRKK